MDGEMRSSISPAPTCSDRTSLKQEVYAERATSLAPRGEAKLCCWPGACLIASQVEGEIRSPGSRSANQRDVLRCSPLDDVLPGESGRQQVRELIGGARKHEGIHGGNLLRMVGVVSGMAIV